MPKDSDDLNNPISFLFVNHNGKIVLLYQTMSTKKNWIDILKQRPGLKSAWKIAVSLIAFAFTGISVFCAEKLLHGLLNSLPHFDWNYATPLFVTITLLLLSIMLFNFRIKVRWQDWKFIPAKSS